jgi:hypothetical protein
VGTNTKTANVARAKNRDIKVCIEALPTTSNGYVTKVTRTYIVLMFRNGMFIGTRGVNDKGPDTDSETIS